MQETTKRTKKPAPTIKGSALIPSQDALRVGTHRRVMYWVGLLPSSPVQSVALAGIDFPKINERIIPDPMRDGETRRVPEIGALVRLDRDQFDALVERLPRTVVRFIDGQAPEDIIPGTVPVSGAMSSRERRGHVITIPRPADIETARAEGRGVHPYIPSSTDVPIANFLFAFPCENQTTGERGGVYPATVAESGLTWPAETGDAAELADLLGS